MQLRGNVTEVIRMLRASFIRPIQFLRVRLRMHRVSSVLFSPSVTGRLLPFLPSVSLFFFVSSLLSSPLLSSPLCILLRLDADPRMPTPRRLHFEWPLRRHRAKSEQLGEATAKGERERE